MDKNIEGMKDSSCLFSQQKWGVFFARPSAYMLYPHHFYNTHYESLQIWAKYFLKGSTEFS